MEWWSGDAVWSVFTTSEFYNAAVVDLLAHQYWLVNIATHTTILIEIAYPFLIWQRRTRPYALAAAITLHVLLATLMGLIYFSFVMIMGHMSFMRPQWLHRLGASWKRRIGEIVMIYDSRSSYGVRSTASRGRLTSRSGRCACTCLRRRAWRQRARRRRCCRRR